MGKVFNKFPGASLIQKFITGAGGEAQIAIRDNYNSVVDPTAQDGENLKYFKGSVWINIVSGSVFVCTKQAEGAAEWANLSSGGGGGGSSAWGSITGTLANQVDLAAALAGKASLAWEGRNTGFNPVAGGRYLCNTGGSAFTATLPASPVAGDEIAFLDSTNTWDTNNLTIARNGQNIEGAASNLICNLEGNLVVLVFVSSYGWRVQG